MEEYHRYGHAGTKCYEQMYETDDGVSLRVIHFKPVAPSPYPPVLMLVGLATIIESFEGIINGLTKDFEVYYVETREKSSSRFLSAAKFDMATVAYDLVCIIRLLHLQNKEYILFGYSFGATVIIESYRHLSTKPTCLLLLSPTPRFYYPKWSLSLIRFAVPLYPVLKPTAKWYLRNFVIDRKGDNDMYLFTSRALDEADPRKLKNAILAIAGYEVWDKLEYIDCATLIVDTSSDGIHVHADIMRMRETIKSSSYIDLQNNRRTHGAELAVVIREYLNKQILGKA